MWLWWERMLWTVCCRCRLLENMQLNILLRVLMMSRMMMNVDVRDDEIYTGWKVIWLWRCFWESVQWLTEREDGQIKIDISFNLSSTFSTMLARTKTGLSSQLRLGFTLYFRFWGFFGFCNKKGQSTKNVSKVVWKRLKIGNIYQKMVWKWFKSFKVVKNGLKCFNNGLIMGIFSQKNLAK